VYAKTAEPFEMLFGELTLVISMNHVVWTVGQQDQTNPFAAVRGDKTAMQPNFLCP